MARFCIATGMSPSEYRALTLLEYQTFIRILEEQNG